MKENKRVLLLFFITIFLSTINEYFTYVYIGTQIGRVISLVDELYVVWLLLYTFYKKRFNLSSRMWIGVLGFSICGLFSNYMHETSITISALGMFNTLKPVIIFMCFVQYAFSWEDFHSLMKKFDFIFPVVAIGFIVDAITPAFHEYLGIGSGYFRAGFRVLSGLFVKETNSVLWALIFYIYYRFYSNGDFYSKAKYILSSLMIFFTFKVKDILGLVVGFTSTMFRRIDIKYLFFGVPVSIVAFAIYMTYMPEHYAEYFDNDGDNSNVARVVLNYTSLSIAKDNLPLGVGFGQFASPTSRDFDSKVYAKYGIDRVWGFTNVEGDANYMCDTFWPMILGETGLLGLIFYILLIYEAFGKILFEFIKDTTNRSYLFPSVLFIVFLIASIGKPVFSGPPHSFVVWGIAGIFYSLSLYTYDELQNK